MKKFLPDRLSIFKTKKKHAPVKKTSMNNALM